MLRRLGVRWWLGAGNLFQRLAEHGDDCGQCAAFACRCRVFKFQLQGHRFAEQRCLVGLAGGQRVGAGACSKRQHLGAQAGGAVRHGQAGQVGFAAVGKLGMDFDGRVQLLLFLVQLHQGGQRLDLCEQRALAVFNGAGFNRDHVAQSIERAAGNGAPVVLQPNPGAVLCTVEVLAHLIDPAAFDLAAVSGGAFGCHAEKFRLACHVGGSGSWLLNGPHVAVCGQVCMVARPLCCGNRFALWLRFAQC